MNFVLSGINRQTVLNYTYITTDKDDVKKYFLNLHLGSFLNVLVERWQMTVGLTILFLHHGPDIIFLCVRFWPLIN